jgi:hypothetical protein
MPALPWTFSLHLSNADVAVEGQYQDDKTMICFVSSRAPLSSSHPQHRCFSRTHTLRASLACRRFVSVCRFATYTEPSPRCYSHWFQWNQWCSCMWRICSPHCHYRIVIHHGKRIFHGSFQKDSMRTWHIWGYTNGDTVGIVNDEGTRM